MAIANSDILITEKGADQPSPGIKSKITFLGLRAWIEGWLPSSSGPTQITRAAFNAAISGSSIVVDQKYEVTDENYALYVGTATNTVKLIRENPVREADLPPEGSRWDGMILEKEVV